MPDKLPAPPPATTTSTVSVDASQELDERSGCLEFLGLIFPLLGLIFWAVYANNKPERAKNIGIYALIGVIVNIVFWIFIIGVSNS
jgi:hypothetical protein